MMDCGTYHLDAISRQEPDGVMLARVKVPGQDWRWLPTDVLDVLDPGWREKLQGTVLGPLVAR